MSHGGAFKGDDFFWWGLFSPSLFWDPALRPGTVTVAHFNGRLSPDSVDSKEGQDWPRGTTRTHVRETGA